MEDILVSGFPIIVKEIFYYDIFFLRKGIFHNCTLSFLYEIFFYN